MKSNFFICCLFSVASFANADPSLKEKLDVRAATRNLGRFASRWMSSSESPSLRYSSSWVSPRFTKGSTAIDGSAGVSIAVPTGVSTRPGFTTPSSDWKADERQDHYYVVCVLREVKRGSDEVGRLDDREPYHEIDDREAKDVPAIELRHERSEPRADTAHSPPVIPRADLDPGLAGCKTRG